MDVEIVGARDDEIELAQRIEQRVARTRDEHLVAGVREELEEHRIGVAGARRHDDAIGRDVESLPRVIARDRVARLGQAERRRRIDEPARIGERRQQVRRIVEAGTRRIRFREIDQWTPGRPLRRDRDREAVRRQLVRNARGKHHGASGRHDGDALDHVAFEHLIDDVDAVQDLGEDGVDVIETRIVDEIDEDLRVAGVVAARRDADGAAHMRPRADLVAHEARVADVLVRAGTAALNHEVRDDAVEREAVVVAGFGEPRGASAKSQASYVPMFAHLGLVFGAGIYLPPQLVTWFQNVAKLLG